MRHVPTAREAQANHGGSQLHYTDSAMASQSLASSSCLLATDSEMDLELKTGSILAPGLSVSEIEHSAQRNVSLSPVPQSPLTSSTADLTTDISAPVTPHMRGISRSESPLSFISSSRLSSSPSAIDRDRSIENTVITQQYIEAYRNLPPSSAGSSVPQFIMPNLPIPLRRPFTDTGRSLGKLRLLVLGSPGTGKTSIIRSIAQCCEHIVHIDAVDTHFNGPVLEVYASTRPYQWWENADYPETLRLRRSSTSVEEILDRNLSFLDFTPQGSANVSHAVDFLESSLNPILQKQMADVDLISLLSNGSQQIVDAVLYMLPSTGLTKEDAEALRRLHAVTNIIPLLARSDELDSGFIKDCKQELQDQLEEQGIEIFSFTPFDEQSDQTAIFAVSNASHSDSDVMDASILMDSAYIEPLLPTDLRGLVNSIFSLDGASRLRHSAAVKVVKWAHGQTRHHPSDSALARHTFNSGVAAVVVDPFSQMRDWRRLEAPGWAQSLRQSLNSERILSTTASSHFANGLLSRASGTVVKHCNSRRRCRKRRHQQQTYDQDPLGLVKMAAQVKNTGALAVELLGGIGVIGYLTLYLTRPDIAVLNMRLFTPVCLAL